MKKIKLLLTTLCCLVGLGCFCNAENINIGPLVQTDSVTNFANGNYNSDRVKNVVNYITGNYYCFSDIYYQSSISYDIYLYRCSGTKSATIDLSSYSYCTQLMVATKTSRSADVVNGNMTCIPALVGSYYYHRNTTVGNAYSVTYAFTNVNFNTLENYFSGSSTCPTCPTCPDQYSSLECQSEYDLIPISSVDQSYCENNNLCPVGGGDCESGSVNWSSLYINNIQHLGKPNIFITIPEEIDWDYTNETGSFDLDIVGYNVDYEKMGEILEVQNYKPSSEDFTNLVGLLAPYMSILVFCLFAYIVIKRLKKPFSSKLK